MFKVSFKHQKKNKVEDYEKNLSPLDPRESRFKVGGILVDSETGHVTFVKCQVHCRISDQFDKLMVCYLGKLIDKVPLQNCIDLIFRLLMVNSEGSIALQISKGVAAGSPF